MLGKTLLFLSHFRRLIWPVLRFRWCEKLIGSVVLFGWVMVPYFWLQHHHQGVRWIVKPSFLDKLVPFHPLWGLPYLLLYPLAWLSILLLSNYAHLRRWWVVNGLMPLPAWLCFYFVQTEYPRPHGGPWPWPYAAIVDLDAPLNVSPCLHSAYTLLAAFSLARTLRGFRPAWVGMWAVTILVLLSIVGTRQHRVVDVMLGSLLAAVAWAWYRRTCDERSQLTLSAAQTQGSGPPKSPALKKN